MQKDRQQRRIVFERFDRRIAEGHALHLGEHRGEGDAERGEQDGRCPGVMFDGRGEDHEFAGEHAEGRHAEDGQSAEHQAPADGRRAADQALDVGDDLRSGHLRGVADGEENRRLGERMHGHVQQSGVGGDAPAHAEGEGDDAHVLDGGEAEQPLDVFLAREVKGGDDDGQQAEAHHHLTGEGCAQRAVDERLAADDGVQRDVEQQAGEHGGDRRRAFGVRVGQPVVQGHEAGLGAVADDHEDESQRQHGRFERAAVFVKMRPEHRARRVAEDLLGREVDEDGAEQRLGDADAAEDEILPGGFETFRRAVEGDEEHRGQRGRFHRHPQDADVVRRQGGEHGAHEHLEHAVVEPQAARREPAVVVLDAHVGAREDRGGEADEGGEGDQEDVERIDEEVFAEHVHRPVTHDAGGQRGGGEKGRQAAGDVDIGRLGPMPDEGEQRRGGERDGEDENEFVHS